jgi:hypothetical protein
VVPFQAVVSPQGFLAAEPPGRLSLINVDDPSRQEYIVHQSTAIADEPCDGTAANAPRFYHEVQYADMDADGYKDIVTVRSAFKPLGPGSFCAFFGDLVYFKNRVLRSMRIPSGKNTCCSAIPRQATGLTCQSVCTTLRMTACQRSWPAISLIEMVRSGSMERRSA